MLGACGGGHGDHKPEAEPQFDDPAMLARKWDDPSRSNWQKPELVIRNLTLATSADVLDLGAGTGYFSVRLSPALPAGKVYASDLSPEMVRYLKARVDSLGLSNVVPVQATATDPGAPGPFDAVLVVNTYHHLGEREAYFRNLKAKLKPDARVAIVDYKTDMDLPGPPESLRIPPEVVIEEMEDAGYALKARSEGLLERQYMLQFVPTAEP